MARKIEMATKEFNSCNVIECTVGTTGFCGGDSGHGGMTLFKLKDLGGTMWDAYVNKDNYGVTEDVKIMLKGDTELETFVDALEWAAKRLRGMMENGK